MFKIFVYAKRREARREEKYKPTKVRRRFASESGFSHVISTFKTAFFSDQGHDCMLLLMLIYI